MSPTPAEQAEARLFWENFNSSSMVREAIEKERADAQVNSIFQCANSAGQGGRLYNAHRAVPEPILSNEVNIPKYNVITIAYIVGACELCFFAGWFLARAFMGGR